MKLLINKNQIEVPEGITLIEYLTNNFSGTLDGIAIAINDQVIPKTNWNSRQLQEEDNILIITATAGG